MMNGFFSCSTERERVISITHLQKTQSLAQNTVGPKNAFLPVQNSSAWLPSKSTQSFTSAKGLSPKMEQSVKYLDSNSSYFCSDYPRNTKIKMKTAPENNDQLTKSSRKRTRVAQRRCAISFTHMLQDSFIASLSDDHDHEQDTFDRDDLECDKKKRRILDHDINTRRGLSGVNAMFTLMTVKGPELEILLPDTHYK